MENIKMEENKEVIRLQVVRDLQEHYELIGDWYDFNLNERLYLKNHIGYALFGPPELSEESNFTLDEIYDYKDKKAMQLIDLIYNKIVEHGIQIGNGKVLCSAIFTYIYDESALKTLDFDTLSRCIQKITVFKIQKNLKSSNIIEYQTWYIDTDGRVYKNWKDYRNNNNLPRCMMIAPKDGIYQADPGKPRTETESTVWVECIEINKHRSFLKALDITNTVLSLGSMGIAVAGMLTPITAPVTIAGLIGITATGLWGGSRAIGELVDRGIHDQSVADKESIPAWLGVAGSTFSLASTGATPLLSKAIRTGTNISKGAQIAHDAIMVGSMATSFLGISYNTYNIIQKYIEHGEVSPKDIFFLSAHVMFFCHASIKFKLASDIIKSDQNQILKEYEDSLRSNRHRKEFRRIVRNTIGNTSDKTSGHQEIIRSLNKINDKDEFFATLVRNLKSFASTSTKLSFTNGKVQVNDVTLISPSMFSSLSKEGILSLVNQASGSNPSSNIQENASTGTTLLKESGYQVSQNLQNLFQTGISSINRNVDSLYTNVSNVFNIICDDIKTISPKVQNKIIHLLLQACEIFIKELSRTERSSEDLLKTVLKFLWDYTKVNIFQLIPGVNKLAPQYQHLVISVLEKILIEFGNCVKEWVEAIREYMKKDKDCVISNQDSQYIHILDPIIIVSLDNNTIRDLIQEALNSTGSRMIDTVVPSIDMLLMCERILDSVYLELSIERNFGTAVFGNRIGGILEDLERFSQKEALLSDLLRIFMNIGYSKIGYQALEIDSLTEYMSQGWVFIIMNFVHIFPEDQMFNDNSVSNIQKIMNSINDDHKADPEKWPSALIQLQSKMELEE